ncbi:hypothetical protein [Mycolicibacterium palauense]|uniref:hypothetical protein n=1 Tax=Mycolicibacterium palauense TaxID=2034511 RepID=UPI000BFEBCE2|nr:hypothetical protein [Mycolicibacterium palauense]
MIPILAAGTAAAVAVVAAPVAGAQPLAPTSPMSLPGSVAPLPTNSTFCDLGVYCDDDEIGSVVGPSGSGSSSRRGVGHDSATGPAAVPQVPGS